jgi:transposase
MHGTMARVEVITSVQRRRRWSAAEKQRMVAESAKPGRTVSEVARRFGIAPQQLFTWRRQLLAAATGAADGDFLAVEIVEPVPTLAGPDAVSAEGGRIEIVLPTGVTIRVGPDVAVEPLRRVLAALG